MTIFANVTAYTPTPRIDDFTPSGPTGGGNIVIINGAGFRPGDRVFFDDREAASFERADGRIQIYAVAPDATYEEGQPFTPHISILHLDGTYTTSTDTYTFLVQPATPVDTTGPPAVVPNPAPPGPLDPNSPSPPAHQPRPQGRSDGCRCSHRRVARSWHRPPCHRIGDGPHPQPPPLPWSKGGGAMRGRYIVSGKAAIN